VTDRFILMGGMGRANTKKNSCKAFAEKKKAHSERKQSILVNENPYKTVSHPKTFGRKIAPPPCSQNIIKWSVFSERSCSFHLLRCVV